jgi:hypothetical protein
MSGDLVIDVMSFLQKFFLYGSLIWLLTQVGWQLRSAIFSTALILFITSEAERFLPGRSAEISDAFMVLVIGTIFALIAPEASKNGRFRSGDGRPAIAGQGGSFDERRADARTRKSD